MGKKTESRKHGMRTPSPETEEKYREAIELYRTTGLPVREICARTGVPFTAFRSFLHSCHRELMFARYGMEAAPEEAAATRLRKRSGQTAASRAKYGEAIRACDDIAYIEYNVSQIAYMFHLDPSGLGSQLRNHYPEIIERRERERHRLGMNDNQHRGVKPWCKEQYAEAVEHLRTTDDTIRRTADLYGLSYSGLREHLLFYHKDLVRKRADKRERAKSGAKVRDALTGNGSRHEPKAGQTEKYREALRLYRDTALTHRQIAEATGITVTGLRNHLRIWNRRLIVEHRGYECREGEAVDLSSTKQYLKSTAAKYAGAIACLKETGRPTAEVAREFGLHPETFREYVREHEPELAARLGMTRLADGRQVLARSMEKYGEAVRLYETTTEPLRSIADRLGLQYNSVGGFVRRSRPDAIEAHNRLVEREEALRKEKEQAESAALALQREAEEKERILSALRQTGGNKRKAAKLLGFCKSTLYNKLNALGLNDTGDT